MFVQNVNLFGRASILLSGAIIWHLLPYIQYFFINQCSLLTSYWFFVPQFHIPPSASSVKMNLNPWKYSFHLPPGIGVLLVVGDGKACQERVCPTDCFCKSGIFSTARLPDPMASCFSWCLCKFSSRVPVARHFAEVTILDMFQMVWSWHISFFFFFVSLA